ncbi:MAG: hypothetical protein U0835_08190 [Isosphaeraceae bacterium]
MHLNSRRTALILLLMASAAVVTGTARFAPVWMGRQPDGGFIVSTGQRVEPGSIAFKGRPIDLAVHPSGDFFAVLNKSAVFLADTRGVREGSNVAPPAARTPGSAV